MIQIGKTTTVSAAEDPIQHLASCHRRIEVRLDTLVRAGEAWRERTAEANEAIGNALVFMETTARLHTEDEEVSFFPRLMQRLDGDEAQLVNRLLSDHTASDEALATLRDLASQLRSGAPVSEAFIALAREIRENYRDHITCEDQQLTSILRRTLTPGDLSEIRQEMQRRRGRNSAPAA